MPGDQLEAAVDQANRAIRDYVATLPPYSHLWTDAQAKRYTALLAAWGDAVRRLSEARAREGEQEPEAVAA